MNADVTASDLLAFQIFSIIAGYVLSISLKQNLLWNIIHLIGTFVRDFTSLYVSETTYLKCQRE